MAHRGYIEPSRLLFRRGLIEVKPDRLIEDITSILFLSFTLS